MEKLKDSSIEELRYGDYDNADIPCIEFIHVIESFMHHIIKKELESDILSN